MVGVLRRPHGLQGEMIMEVVTDFPERLVPGTLVYLGDQHEARKISGSRPHQQGLLITLSGADDPGSAGRLRGREVYVKSSDRPALPDGMYYHHEILGFDVVDESDQRVGRLTEILQTGANDVYVVSRPDGGEALLPVIPGVILGIDRAERKIRVREMPGLSD